MNLASNPKVFPMNDKTAKPEDNQIEVLNNDNNEGAAADRGLQAPPQGSADNDPPAPPPQDGANPDDSRAAIAARFKRVREDKEPAVEATGDFLHPSQTYGQVGADQKQPDPPPAEPEAPVPAAKRKLKVNGQEIERTQEEIDAAAQKSFAADDYLEQAKKKLKDAEQVLETTRVHVSRQNPAERPAPTAAEGDDNDGQQNPADPLKDVIQEIQYGDPDKAKDLLGKTIADAATAAARTVSSQDRVREDIAKDLLAHDEFVKKNPNLAEDEDAHDFIRSGLLRGYREDLRKIGVPDENIPTDTSQLANLHRRHKLEGKSMRSVSTLLDAAHERLTTFRGGAPRAENPNPQPSAEPRVEVNLNRDDRRRAIPQQPQRANVQPSQNQNQPASQQDSRKSAVQRAQAARGQG